MNRRIYHYFPSFIISFFIVIVAIIAQLTFFAKNQVLNPDTYNDAMTKSNVFDATYEDLNTYFTRISAATGVPAEVYMEGISKSDLSGAMRSYINEGFDYMAFRQLEKPQIDFDFTAMEKSITDYFEEYAEQNNIEKDKEYYKLLKDTLKMSKSQVNGKIDILFIEKITSSSVAVKLHNYSHLIDWLAYGSIALIIVLAVWLIVINRHHHNNIIYWAGTTCLGSSVVIFIPVLIAKINGTFSNFFVSSKDINLAVTGIISKFMNKIIFFESIMIIIGIALIVLCAILKKRDYYRRSHSHK